MHKLAKFSANPGKVHFEELVHLSKYIRDNKTLVLKYYADTNDAPVSDLLRKAIIKTENHFMAFSDYILQYCPDTVRSTGAYIIFYQSGPIDHGTHFPGSVAQSSAESDYNEVCTTGMALAHFRMLIHEFLNKDTYIVSDKAHIILLDSKSAMCIVKNDKDTKLKMHISRIMLLVRNGEKCKMHKVDWCQ